MIEHHPYVAVRQLLQRVCLQRGHDPRNHEAAFVIAYTNAAKVSPDAATDLAQRYVADLKDYERRHPVDGGAGA